MVHRPDFSELDAHIMLGVQGLTLDLLGSDSTLSCCIVYRRPWVVSGQVPGLENGRNHQAYLWELLADSSWSGALKPKSAVLCGVANALVAF